MGSVIAVVIALIGGFVQSRRHKDRLAVDIHMVVVDGLGRRHRLDRRRGVSRVRRPANRGADRLHPRRRRVPVGERTATWQSASSA